MVCKIRSVCNMRTVLFFLCNKTTKLNKNEREKKKTFQSSSHSDEMFRWLSVTHAFFNLHRLEKSNGLTGGYIIAPSMLCVATHTDTHYFCHKDSSFLPLLLLLPLSFYRYPFHPSCFTQITVI